MGSIYVTKVFLLHVSIDTRGDVFHFLSIHNITIVEEKKAILDDFNT